MLVTLLLVSAFVFFLRFSISPSRHQFWKPEEHTELAKFVEISEVEAISGSGGEWSLRGTVTNKADCALVALVIVYRPEGFGTMECLTSIEELAFEEKKPFQVDVLVPREQVKEPYKVFVAEAQRKIT